MTEETEMPKYNCTKQVWALKIKAVEYDHLEAMAEGRETDGSATIIFDEEGYAPIKVDYDYWYKRLPQPGGYYVVYKDGYASYSPPVAFEEGYTLVE